MVYNSIIKGKYVDLRSATVDDAESTYLMRQNIEKTKFLHKVNGTIDDQRAWIANHAEMDDDYFFVVEDKEKKPIGMMGISEISRIGGHPGRVLMYGNSIQSFEAYYLLIKFGFDVLGLQEQYGDTDVNNASALKFSKSFGMRYGEPQYDPDMDRMMMWGTIYRSEWDETEKRIRKLLYRKEQFDVVF